MEEQRFATNRRHGSRKSFVNYVSNLDSFMDDYKNFGSFMYNFKIWVHLWMMGSFMDDYKNWSLWMWVHLWLKKFGFIYGRKTT